MTDGNTETVSATARAPRRLVSAPSSPPDLTRRAFVATAAAAWIPCALAQGGWPAARPITWVVPYPAGGTTDILGRGLAPILATALGTPVVCNDNPDQADVVGRSHFLHPQALGDQPDCVLFLAEGEQGLDGEFCALFGVHRTKV